MAEQLVGELFCGAGGLGLGARSARLVGDNGEVWTCAPLWGVDSNKWACETYRRNLGAHVICDDVRSVPFDALRNEKGRINGLLFGFPHNISHQIEQYPIMLTRSLTDARKWLKRQGLGQRRYGLVASYGARRLRADGVGVLLGADDKDKIAQWYLEVHEDIRSSFALEVPANEYACQGLEIDFAAVCWGGDMLYDPTTKKWLYQTLGGTAWKCVHSKQGQVYVRNKYRVLMTRAREGMIIWVPLGDAEDSTRDPKALDATARFLRACGAKPWRPNE